MQFSETSDLEIPRKHEKRISLSQDFVQKSEYVLGLQLSDRVIFANSKNMYALMNAGTSLTKVMTDYWTSYSDDQKLQLRSCLHC